MLDLRLPARHDWAVQEQHYGKLVMEPFEPGFALTVGIAYRRALLSAIHGAAPTWVKIEHVLHEFSHLGAIDRARLFWSRAGHAGERLSAIARSVAKRAWKGRSRGES